MTRRPLGLSVFSVMNILYGLVCLWWGVAVMPGITQSAYPLPVPIWQHAASVIFGDAVGVTVVELMGVWLSVSGVALLLLKEWGRQFAVMGAAVVAVSQFICVIVMISGLVYQSPQHAWVIGRFIAGYALPGLIWNACVVWYLQRPSVKAQFVSRRTAGQ